MVGVLCSVHVLGGHNLNRPREWRKFKNGARSDNLELSHWVKAGQDPEAGTRIYLRMPLYPSSYSVFRQTTLLPNIMFNRCLMSSLIMSTRDFSKVRPRILDSPVSSCPTCHRQGLDKG